MWRDLNAATLSQNIKYNIIYFKINFPLTHNLTYNYNHRNNRLYQLHMHNYFYVCIPVHVLYVLACAVVRMIYIDCRYMYVCIICIYERMYVFSLYVYI